MSHDTLPPTPDPIEDRLRATLAAEADRHPVTPDLEGLRSRADRTVIDLTLPPRRNRARIVALAAALALVAGAVGAVALRASTDDDDEPVIADEPPPTGYYLPGDGWEVQTVSLLPSPTLPGTERMVQLGEPLDELESEEPVVAGDATIVVSRLTETPIDLGALATRAGLEGITTAPRGDGGSAREYVLANVSVSSVGDDPPPTPEEADAEGGTLLAAVDDRLLSIDWYGPGQRDRMLELADRWWESGGDAVVVDPATGLTRISDTTYLDVEAVAADDLFSMASADDLDPAALLADALPQVVVVVESPDGWTGAYTLGTPGGSLPTGFFDPDAGAAAGLTSDDLGGALPTAIGGPQPAWETHTAITAEVPGAVVGVAPVSYVTDPMTPDQARELWAALAPVSQDRWVDAAGAVEDSYIPDEAWGDMLGETDARSLFEAMYDVDEGSSSFSEEGELIEGEGEGEPVEPIEVAPSDGVNPAAGLPLEQVRPIVADAIGAMIDRTGPIDPDLFAPAITFAYQDEPDEDAFTATFTDIVEGSASLDPIGPDMPDDPGLEAWNVLWTIGPVEMVEIVDEVDACPPLGQRAVAPTVVVLMVDNTVEGEEPCSDWSALVVTLDQEQRIVLIESAYGPT